MKKHSHFNSMLNFCYSHFLTRKGFDISLYSTRANAANISFNYASANKLYRMISPLGDPNVSIVPILDQWVEQVGTLDKGRFITIIKELRHYRRYKHALELSLWMTDKRYHPLTRGDAAIRLDLIAKVYGIVEAENYFNSLPRQLKSHEVYSALINCYASAKLVEKAEGIVRQMKDMGFSRSKLIYNRLLSLYRVTGNHEKMKALLQEMEKEGLGYDSYTCSILLSAYASNSDVNGIENIISRLEFDSEIVLDWHVYFAAGRGYSNAGLLDKALEMLKKSEELISTTQRKNVAFENLLSQYTNMGKRDEVLRLWQLYKTQLKVYNKGYLTMMYSLIKLDDVESAEEIFEEWESCNLSYDLRIPNYLIGAYCRKGQFEKAETLVNRVTAKGERPDARTWFHFSTGYCRHNQFKDAIEAIKKEIIAFKPTWDVNKDNLAAILNYLKGQGDLEGAEEIVNLLADKDIVSEDVQKRLLSYLKEGESSSTALIQILRDGVNGNEDTSELTEEEEDGNISSNI